MRTRTRRPAFTLIELLVVISIIAVLAALLATAVFAARRGAQKQNAEATLTKLDQKLLQKMKDMRDRIEDDYKNNRGEAEFFKKSALRDKPDVIKAVMMYGRMRRDFPMTFAEATSDFPVAGYTYVRSPAFRDLPSTGPGDYEESAACFFAAIAQMGTEGLEGQITTTPGGRKVFTDGFGGPIAFVRLGYDGNGNELNPPNLAYDPFYPNKVGSTYRNLAADYPGGAAAFEPQVWDAVRPTVGWVAVPPDYPGLKNHTAFLVSPGPNGTFVDPGFATVYDGDNLLSYRLRKEGGRGD